MGFVVEFLRGFWTPVRALGFLLRRPRLWILAAVPALFTFGALMATGSFAVRHFDEIQALVLPASLQRSANTGLEGLGQEILRTISDTIVLVCVIAGVFVTSILVGKVLAAPFNDALSARAEVAYTGLHKNDERFSVWAALKSGWWAAGWELRKALLYFVVMAFLLGLNLLPVLGPFMYAGITFTFNVVFMALDYLDFPLERRPGPDGKQLGIRARYTLVWKYRSAMMGYGVITSALLFIPGVNVIFVPLAVVGATLLYIDVAEGGVPQQTPPEPDPPNQSGDEMEMSS